MPSCCWASATANATSASFCPPSTRVLADSDHVEIIDGQHHDTLEDVVTHGG